MYTRAACSGLWSMPGLCSLRESISWVTMSLLTASSGSGPNGEAGKTEDGVGLEAGGRRSEARKTDERAMKVPVRPTPAEHPTMIGGSRSSSVHGWSGDDPGCIVHEEISRLVLSTSWTKERRLVMSGRPWSGHERYNKCWKIIPSLTDAFLQSFLLVAPSTMRCGGWDMGTIDMVLWIQCACLIDFFARSVTFSGGASHPSSGGMRKEVPTSLGK